MQNLLVAAAALTTTDELPLPVRHASANTTLVRGNRSSTNAATNWPRSQWKNLGVLGDKISYIFIESIQ